ncbi:uncharacterized protein METZ01_LOCUS181177 [marine metagenome]|uniref:Uncharacterized protein n=1 Tax=marine metagenome TaxID=408172 RepID=A0A382CSN7_9ZZZZ
MWRHVELEGIEPPISSMPSMVRIGQEVCLGEVESAAMSAWLFANFVATRKQRQH